MQATFKVNIKMHWTQAGKVEIFDTTMQDLMENDDDEDDESDEENEEPVAVPKDKNNNKVVEKGREIKVPGLFLLIVANLFIVFIF